MAMSNNRRAQRRAAILGTVSGLLVALCGVGTGIYFGVLKPSMEIGAKVVVPVRFLVVSAVMLTLVGVFGIYRLLRWGRSPPNDQW
jgi:ABC-type nickel/cobalt efflux system permease component RcnA